ncbi:hypothetical protein [Paenibacillus sp. 7541]|nr:hypothetical protein [Paenibacillus sp. 7541]
MRGNNGGEALRFLFGEFRSFRAELEAAADTGCRFGAFSRNRLHQTTRGG